MQVDDVFHFFLRDGKSQPIFGAYVRDSTSTTLSNTSQVGRTRGVVKFHITDDDDLPRLDYGREVLVSSLCEPCCHHNDALQASPESMEESLSSSSFRTSLSETEAFVYRHDCTCCFQYCPPARQRCRFLASRYEALRQCDSSPDPRNWEGGSRLSCDDGVDHNSYVRGGMGVGA